MIQEPRWMGVKRTGSRKISGLKQIALPLLAAASFLVSSAPAQAADPIRVGEINSYKRFAAFLVPYRQGWEMALEEVNAAGGINGRPLEIIARDDGGNPGNAVRAAEELLAREKVDLLAGGFLSHIGLALSDFALQRKTFFLAGEPLTDKIVWEKGNDYTFRLRPSTYMQVAMLVPEAVKSGKKRWAMVYPNYEYGQSAAATFKKLMTEAMPDVEFVGEQAPPLLKIDAGAVVQALEELKPDGVFNVLFGSDLAKFVREGNTRDLFKDREVISLLTGEPEYLDPLKKEAPEGWLVTGYPWDKIDIPEHQAFLAAYQKKYDDYPRTGSIVGYAMVKALAAGLIAADSTDSQDLIKAFRGLSFDTPFGKAMFREQDQQSTLGAFVGRTTQVDGKGTMKDFSYQDGADFQPSDEEVAARRGDAK
ncbi:MAG: ABC transporter substrate-binding protein [Burkholderiaceae bacterium]